MFKDFDALARDTKEKMQSFSDYPAKTFSRFDGITKVIRTVMDQETCVYSPEVAEKWLNDFFNDKSHGTGTFQRYRRVIMLLNDNFVNNLAEWKVYPKFYRVQPASDSFIHLAADYQESMHLGDYAIKTIYCRMHDVYYFLVYLESIGIFRADKITHKIISNYLSSSHFQGRKPGGVSTEIIGLRKFIAYLEDKKLVNSDNLHYVCISKVAKSKRIVTTYTTTKQINTLTGTFKDFPTNFRNRAAYLIALKCGVRTCDIMNLKFENVNFDKKEIHIIQEKTNEPLSIPFDNEVSNAIIDYILNERRDCECPYIFISAIGPIRKLTHNTSLRTHARFNRIMDCDFPKQYGLHILRRTFASNLLKTGAEVSIIASALGHINNGTVDRYLSTDEEKVKLCALSIEGFPYQGGLF